MATRLVIFDWNLSFFLRSESFILYFNFFSTILYLDIAHFLFYYGCKLSAVLHGRDCSRYRVNNSSSFSLFCVYIVSGCSCCFLALKNLTEDNLVILSFICL